MDPSEYSVATAFDRKYLWGAILMIASLRAYNVMVPVRALVSGLSPEEIQFLLQMRHVEVIAVENRRIGTTDKPEIILSSPTRYTVWIDADCIMTGDVSPLLYDARPGLTVQLRNQEQTAAVYQSRYEHSDASGTIPAKVLEIWRHDVGQNADPAIDRIGVANCFTVSREYFPFIEQWKTQMAKVLPTRALIDPLSLAYYQTDEAVLNSLLAFSSIAPPLHPYILDREPHYLVHFYGSPKPWVMWRTRNVRRFDQVIYLIDWCQRAGYPLPPIPFAFRKGNKIACMLIAYLYQCAVGIKEGIKALLKWTGLYERAVAVRHNRQSCR